MNMLMRYARLLRPCRKLCVLTILLAGTAAVAEGLAMAALIPLLDSFSGRSSALLDRPVIFFGKTPEGATLLLLYLVFFVFLAALAAITRSLAGGINFAVQTRVEATVRNKMTDALLAMEWSYFIKMRQGDISKAMVVEGMQIGTGAMFVVSAAGSMLAALCYLTISFAVSVDLTLISILFGLLGGGVYLLASYRIRRYADQLSQLVGNIGERATELFGNLKYFRATGQEDALRDRSRELFHSYGRTYLRSQLFAPTLQGGIEILAALFIAGFLFYHLGIKQGPVAEMLVFLAIFYRMVPRLLNTQSSLFQARTYLTWLTTYETRLEEAEKNALQANGSATPCFEHAIRLVDVSVHYPEQPTPVLENIQLEIKKGSFVALVGPSGGGKTTLTDLLTGLLTPSSGCLLIDGQKLDNVDIKSWRTQIGLVMQEPFMFHASVAANVAMTNSAVDRERVEQSLKQADAWEFVSALEQGMDTVIAEKGARLSGGQRQRIAIARALYRKPALLILDEATSALDGQAEERIQTVIDGMRHQITMLAVAHRLKTVQQADKIYVVAEGGIKESGSWDELMAQHGMFYEMAKLQGME